MKTILTTAAVVLVSIFTTAHASQSDSSVYICTGRKAVVYHKTKHCRGLNNCQGDVERVSLSAAKQMGRRGCGICYR